MKKFSIVNWIFLAVSIFIVTAIPAFGIYTALTQWDGMCYGFGCCSWKCTFLEYAMNDMSLVAVCLIPLLVIVLGVWLLLTIVRRVKSN